MLDLLKQEMNMTRTENGAVTHHTAGSGCLDLFATIGALRSADEEEILRRFLRAYAEDADLAMKTLFFARDVRGGIGERRVFRVILKWLADNEPDSVKKNIPFVAEFGRYDDLLSLVDTACEGAAMDCIRKQLDADLSALKQEDASVSLLGKWLPSVNASNRKAIRLGKRVAHAMGMNDAEYRKTLSALRRRIEIIENNLREKDYTFDYEKQPSKAMLKYRKAFLRNDGERYNDYLSRVAVGEAKLHTGTLAPYEIIAPIVNGSVTLSERKAMDVTWNAQEDFTGDENALVVMDGSGSMYWSATKPTPASVALSLAIYFAERNTGAFRNHFITFSMTPRLVEIKGADIYQKVRYCKQFDEIANTNLEAVFTRILYTAVNNKVPQSEMPAKLYIISDMEFDACVANGAMTNFEQAKQLYARFGYTLPEVVFWNVDSRSEQQPVRMHETGTALVSGCSARIFSMLKDNILDPYSFMLSVLNAERYACIAA